MELQQLHVGVLSLILVQIHCERMFAFEDALVEIHMENNRMMRQRALESLLRICIQFHKTMVGICECVSMRTFYAYPNTCSIRYDLYYLRPFI